MSASRDWPLMIVHVRRVPGSDKLQAACRTQTRPNINMSR